MTDLVERLRDFNFKAARWPVLNEAADEIERLRKEGTVELAKALMEIERLTAALQALHDWYVEYARINNLFNADGSPATFHELLEARRALEPKP